MIKRGDKERSLLAKLSPRRRKNKSQSSRSPGIGNGGGGGNGFATTPPAGKGMASAGSSGGGGGSSVESMAEDAPTIPQTPGMMPYTIPTRYLVGCGMDLKEAARRWGITWQWRKDKDIDGLLERPMPHCEEAKRVWKHHFHRRAKHNFMEPDKPGKLVWYDQINPSGLSELNNFATLAEMEDYYYFIFEYAYKYLEPADPGGRCVNVYDLSKLTLSALIGKGGDFGKRMMKGCNLHYPERADKVFILNAPRFFAYLWGIVSVFVDPRTQAKINISSSSSMPAMLDYVGAENVPKCYGGTDECDLGEAPEELQFRDFVRRGLGGGSSGPAAFDPSVDDGAVDLDEFLPPPMEHASATNQGQLGRGKASLSPSSSLEGAGGGAMASPSVGATAETGSGHSVVLAALTGVLGAVLALWSCGRLPWLTAALQALSGGDLHPSALPPYHPSYVGLCMGLFLGSGLVLVS